MATLTHQDLKRLNAIFDTPDFGRTPSGQLRVRWFDTTELSYYVEGSKEKPRAISLKRESNLIELPGADKVLYVVTNDWVRHSWAERLGKGWVLAIWKPPIPRETHVALYGEKAPWQSEGEYHLIENTYRPESEPPNERASFLLRQLLIRMFDAGANPEAQAGSRETAKSSQILDALTEHHAKEHQKTVDTIMDEVDDILPAFGKAIPGVRSGGVSIGGI